MDRDQVVDVLDADAMNAARVAVAAGSRRRPSAAAGAGHARAHDLPVGLDSGSWRDRTGTATGRARRGGPAACSRAAGPPSRRTPRDPGFGRLGVRGAGSTARTGGPPRRRGNADVAARPEQRVIGANIEIDLVAGSARRLAIHGPRVDSPLPPERFSWRPDSANQGARQASSKRRDLRFSGQFLTAIASSAGRARSKDSQGRGICEQRRASSSPDGEVILIAKGGNFLVKLDNGHEVLAKLAGKVRRHRIRVVLGDRVTVAVSPYDPTRGFIVYRQR